MIDLYVVVVGFHSRDLVIRCLDSVPDAAAGLSCTITVVDNGSGDGTVAAVEGWAADRPWLEVTATDLGANTGFAHAANAGMALGHAAYVALLNPDTVADPGSLTRLVEALRTLHSVPSVPSAPSVLSGRSSRPSEPAAIVAPTLRYADGRPQLTARSFPTASAGLFGRRSVLTKLLPGNRWSRRFLVERDHAGETEPYRVDWVSGAAMVLPRVVLDRFGGFDEGYFLFWEDADWCRRLAGAGYSVWCVPDATVRHDEGGTRRHTGSALATRSFHAGAYRYWRTHHAPQPWNPLRWAAAAALGSRALLLLAAHRVERLAAPRNPLTEGIRP